MVLKVSGFQSCYFSIKNYFTPQVPGIYQPSEIDNQQNSSFSGQFANPSSSKIQWQLCPFKPQGPHWVQLLF